MEISPQFDLEQPQPRQHRTFHLIDGQQRLATLAGIMKRAT